MRSYFILLILTLSAISFAFLNTSFEFYKIDLLCYNSDKVVLYCHEPKTDYRITLSFPTSPIEEKDGKSFLEGEITEGFRSEKINITEKSSLENVLDSFGYTRKQYELKKKYFKPLIKQTTFSIPFSSTINLENTAEGVKIHNTSAKKGWYGLDFQYLLKNCFYDDRVELFAINAISKYIDEENVLSKKINDYKFFLFDLLKIKTENTAEGIKIYNIIDNKVKGLTFQQILNNNWFGTEAEEFIGNAIKNHTEVKYPGKRNFSSKLINYVNSFFRSKNVNVKKECQINDELIIKRYNPTKVLNLIKRGIKVDQEYVNLIYSCRILNVYNVREKDDKIFTIFGIARHNNTAKKFYYVMQFKKDIFEWFLMLGD